MIVDCGVYADGVRQDLAKEPETVAQAIDDHEDCFGWIGLYEPSAVEMSRVQKLFGLHELAVEDALKAHQRPKVERYGDSIVVVLRTLWYPDSGDAVETGQVSVFVGKRYVVTVRHGEGAPLTTARAELEERASVLGHGPAAVLWAICDSIVDGYEEVAEAVEVDVDEIETSVFSPERTSDAERIYTLKREVLEMLRAIVPLQQPIESFAHGAVPLISREAAPFFRDVADHVIRVSDQTEALDTLLSSALNAHLARVSVQQNDDMRRISAWVAIAAAPTALAGIYGMNFRHMPELTWHYGYYGVLALMLVTCAIMYAAFRRAGWL
ncbi:magnesium/cobalt transporter CorA [Kribbella qitaiheensis]|uniref:Magnesium transport protein CorA n=1 Tax=Kribbella qitaiheensis TaxID=1544730 RepID=A0A7G6WST1_9ACTN|nr:magnesium/cobalt transporter CorA [Kribbella qitaiheensis]QNE17046.1 magnesium/cobalt transporter CorA [Kribbella qitaiheensis]